MGPEDWRNIAVVSALITSLNTWRVDSEPSWSVKAKIPCYRSGGFGFLGCLRRAPTSITSGVGMSTEGQRIPKVYLYIYLGIV